MKTVDEVSAKSLIDYMRENDPPKEFLGSDDTFDGAIPDEAIEDWLDSIGQCATLETVLGKITSEHELDSYILRRVIQIGILIGRVFETVDFQDKG